MCDKCMSQEAPDRIVRKYFLAEGVPGIHVWNETEKRLKTREEVYTEFCALVTPGEFDCSYKEGEEYILFCVDFRCYGIAIATIVK